MGIRGSCDFRKQVKSNQEFRRCTSGQRVKYGHPQVPKTAGRGTVPGFRWGERPREPARQ